MGKNIEFSRNEELANGISHLVAAILSLAGLVLMVKAASLRGDARHLISTAIFGSSMVILYSSSTLTHVLPGGRIRDHFFNLDRISIYFLIAGTYTPLALAVLGGTLGWVLFGIEWSFALVGSLFVLLKPGEYKSGVNRFYVASYVIMGWLVLFAIVPVIQSLPFMGWLWILLGGLTYSIGIPFFRTIVFPYHHLVWHLLVIAGNLCHFFAVYFYMIPD